MALTKLVVEVEVLFDTDIEELTVDFNSILQDYGGEVIEVIEEERGETNGFS